MFYSTYINNSYQDVKILYAIIVTVITVMTIIIITAMSSLWVFDMNVGIIISSFAITFGYPDMIKIYDGCYKLTLSGQVTHICFGTLTIINSDNGFRLVGAKPSSKSMLYYW